MVSGVRMTRKQERVWMKYMGPMVLARVAATFVVRKKHVLAIVAPLGSVVR
jgi:hypothetical protein